ncbi:MAG: phage integrase N-terminal SAM-like domain-containing protein [Nitrosomonas sp.]|nr:phage integrase N-terminal SAM-like domain-containing protein [Nitrosomonas sp.]
MTQENTTIPPAKKLLDQVREKIRFKHYSLSTTKTYISWTKHYIVFNGKRHPANIAAYAASQLCHTYFAGWIRYPHGAGAAGA